LKQTPEFDEKLFYSYKAKVEPSNLDKAGMPSKYVYVKNKTKPIENILPLSQLQNMDQKPNLIFKIQQ